MFWQGKDTLTALHLLVNTAYTNKKRILFWIGAGVSSWCEYPLWLPLAKQLHHDYKKYEQTYDIKQANTLIDSKDLPTFFGYCKSVDPQRYRQMLVDTFATKHITPVYQRFIGAIRAFENPKIITTNVEETLEHNLPDANTIQYHDLERVPKLISEDQSFILKIHGSISSIDSLIFTDDDYRRLTENKKYITLLENILSNSSIVFLGYSISDDYLLRMLSRNADLKSIFGDGPHFAILSDKNISLPESVKQIIYKPEISADHRAAIRILEEMVYTPKMIIPISSRQQHPIITPRSAHFISDIFPPGTWESSQTLNITNSVNETRILYVGTGLTDSEIQNPHSTAIHDIIVGLICFDEIYMPLDIVWKVHDLLGSDNFWNLMRSDVFKFIHWESEEGVVFDSEPQQLGGTLVSLVNHRMESIYNCIRTQLKAFPGKEKEAEENFTLLEKVTVSLPKTESDKIVHITRGLLLFPSIRKSLGISEGISPIAIPNWLTFPINRLAHIIRIGITCNFLGLASTKFLFGASELAGPAFSACIGSSLADEAASYVLSGRYNTDLGEFIINDPELIKGVLAFRESIDGFNLRKEILDQLCLNEGSELNASVNAGLRASIPGNILERARNTMEGLLTPTNKAPISALWKSFSDSDLSLWRKHSLENLKAHLAKYKISIYDYCPCGSGEKVKFCCLQALKN